MGHFKLNTILGTVNFFSDMLDLELEFKFECNIRKDKTIENVMVISNYSILLLQIYHSSDITLSSIYVSKKCKNIKVTRH